MVGFSSSTAQSQRFLPALPLTTASDLLKGARTPQMPGVPPQPWNPGQSAVSQALFSAELSDRGESDQGPGWLGSTASKRRPDAPSPRPTWRRRAVQSWVWPLCQRARR